jgi:Alginate export
MRTKSSGSSVISPEENRRPGRLATVFVTFTLFAPSSLAQTTPSSQTAPSAPPSYKQLRYEEDWSFLRDPTRRADVLDRIKYIPLGDKEDWYLTIGGEARMQYERFGNPGWGRGPEDGGGYLLQRYMLHADLHLGDRARVFFQIKSGLENGRTGGPRPVDEDKLDVHQAFVDVALPSGAERPLVIRVGRQELLFGSARLIGPRDGPNVRQSFDGLRASFQSGAWRVNGFVAKPVETRIGLFDDAPDHAQTFWGMYAARPFALLPNGKVDLYYLGTDRKRARFDQGTAREIRHSIGARLWGEKQAWDYNCELVYQLGKFGRGNILAWTVGSDIGYTFRSAQFRPRLGLKADIASGDRNRSDRNLQTFNALFPRGQYFGDAGLIGLANLMDVHPSADIHITDRMAVKGDWAFFWRESKRDGIYGNGIDLLRSGQTSRARYIGSQPSLLLEWKANRHVTFETSWTYFFAGQFLKETMPGRNLDYITARVTYKF